MNKSINTKIISAGMVISMLITGTAYAQENSETSKDNYSIDKSNIRVENPIDIHNLCGGWANIRLLNEDDLKVFNETKGTLLGVEYEPLIVSTQIVAGTNYKFICKAETVSNKPKKYLAEVNIFKPLSFEKNNKAIIKSINKINE
ncbi:MULTISPECIES: hypothetical protein [unclassified Clostridioides]|uniref:hypothetical protein n=1 Tax=unclassified Clostridioides TaxID=2635829 RepID=UPI001D1069AA